jgi:hypothetical protein
MGHLQAVAMKGVASADQALLWHLGSNHYPPIPAIMLGPCKRAIRNLRTGNDQARIKLPAGVLWRGQKMVPTHALAEHAHLYDLA